MHVIEALCLLNQLSGRGCAFIGRIGGERLGVVGDEIVMHPARLIAFNAKLGETRLGLLHERFGFGDGWRVLGSNNGSARENESGEQEQFHVISDIALVTEGSKAFTTEDAESHREAAGRTRDYARVKWKLSNDRGNSVDHHCRIPEMLRVSSLLLAIALPAVFSSAQERAASGPQAGMPAQINEKNTRTTADSPSANSSKLVIKKRVPANYPDEARAQFLQGRVMIKFQITESGDVESAEVVSGPILDRKTALEKAALDAARQWKFEPYLRDNKPVSVTTTLPFDFNMEGQVPDWGTRAAPERRENPSGQGPVQGKIVHKVPPNYPQEAKLRHLTGPVLLDAQIGKDGNVCYLHVVQGYPVLAKAAIDAVRQWKYAPYILAGAPVEVNTQITVNFALN